VKIGSHQILLFGLCTFFSSSYTPAPHNEDQAFLFVFVKPLLAHFVKLILALESFIDQMAHNHPSLPSHKCRSSDLNLKLTILFWL
jgi:hypothetical protein